MLNLIKIEFLKLRRRNSVWLMLLAALFMPVLGVLYFTDMKNVIDAVTFYKWTAFSYTQWIILPVILGMLCTIIMCTESRNDMLKQLWIVPVNSFKYFISKFTVVFIYSVCFMVIVAVSSVICAWSVDYITFSWGSTIFLFVKCMEISVITAFSMLPILAISAAQKGFILPMCAAIIYAFLGFMMLMINMYFHPLSSMSAIVSRNIPGVSLNQPLNIPTAVLCIAIWGTASTIFANLTLRARK